MIAFPRENADPTQNDRKENRNRKFEVWLFIADEEGFATVIYTAVGEKGSATKEYKVRVIDTWAAEESLDMSKYFYGENITSVADSDSVKVSSTVDTEYTSAPTPTNLS